MKPESPIAWVLRILPACNIPPQLASWNEINMKISELRRIENQDLTPGSMYCPAPGCTYKCNAPKGMDPTDTVLCPHHSTPMTVMTWKQMSEEAAMTMINMQKVIDERDGMVDAFTQRHMQLTEQMQVLAGQTLQAARMMQNAEAEAAEARAKLDDLMFMDSNEKDQLEYFREMFGSPFNRFALRMEREIRANAYKGDWDQWEPSVDTLKSEIGHHFGKLCQAMQQKNINAVNEFAADIGNFMLKAIQLYGNPSPAS